MTIETSTHLYCVHIHVAVYDYRNQHAPVLCVYSFDNLFISLQCVYTCFIILKVNTCNYKRLCFMFPLTQCQCSVVCVGSNVTLS